MRRMVEMTRRDFMRAMGTGFAAASLSCLPAAAEARLIASATVASVIVWL